jgi:ABC-type glycerol-3-phosphate transport system substrate-binding protein
MFKNIVFGTGLLAALISLLIFSGRLPIGKSKEVVAQGDVMVWGTLPQNQIENLFQSINNQTKTYRISYQEVPESNFSGALLEALASGRGPDLILTPYQMILEQRNKIYPFPVQSMSEQQFRDYYVDGAAILYSERGALGLPVSIEPLMLFYNRTLFSKEGIISPPVTWADVTSVTPKFTSFDGNNRISQSAIALGTTNNISIAKDMLMTLVAQLGQFPVTRFTDGKVETLNVLADTPLQNDTASVRPLTTATRFFTEFADPSKSTYTWSPLQPQAENQFLAEKLAMYIAYAGEEKTLKAKNPRLDFGMKALPQAKGKDTFVTGMRLYGVATLARSSNLTAALTAQALLSSAQYNKALADAAGGFSPSRSVIAQDQTMSQELRQSLLVARGWYDSLPKESTALVQIMVADILTGKLNIGEAVDSFVTRLSEAYTRR